MARSMLRPLAPFAPIVLLSACDLITGSSDFEVEILIEGTVSRVVIFDDGTPSFATSAPAEEIGCLRERPRHCRLSETVPFTIYNRGTKTVLLEASCGAVLQHRTEGRWPNGSGRICTLSAIPPIEILAGERLFTDVGALGVPDGEYRLDLWLSKPGGGLLSPGERRSTPFILRRPWN